MIYKLLVNYKFINYNNRFPFHLISNFFFLKNIDKTVYNNKDMNRIPSTVITDLTNSNKY